MVATIPKQIVLVLLTILDKHALGIELVQAFAPIAFKLH
jgi:hypothetical protein